MVYLDNHNQIMPTLFSMQYLTSDTLTGIRNTLKMFSLISALKLFKDKKVAPWPYVLIN